MAVFLVPSSGQLVFVQQIVDQCFFFDLLTDEPLAKVESGPIFFFQSQIGNRVDRLQLSMPRLLDEFALANANDK
ncbi:MAG: hypothetical protein R3C56_21105 [Pirellulaceae bacterium]